jgi:hypothetical protein
MYKHLADTQKGVSDWTRFNVLMTALLKSILAKVEETNVILKQKLAAVDGASKTLESGLKALNPLWTAPPAGIPKETVEQTRLLVYAALGCQEDLAALRGLVDFNVGFNKDIATLANITKKITELNLKALDASVAKKLLVQFGTDLQKIWDSVRPMCTVPTQVTCLAGALKTGRS